MVKFKVSLKIENIGPHFGANVINEIKEVDSNKAIFYAVNGTGKSFISRSFRLAEILPHYLCDDLLTLGKNMASFTFAILTDMCSKEISIHLERGKIPIVENHSNLIFHVFNSDFVDENIRPNNYTPNGEIDGYILGKAQIDLSAEKLKEKTLNDEINALESSIYETIIRAKRQLQEKGVANNTTELSLFTIDKLQNPPLFKEIGTFIDVCGQLDKLSKVPESLEDIRPVIFNINIDYFKDVETMLTTPFSLSTWDEEFVKYYKENRTFIEYGLKKVNSGETVCPFCNREFDNKALDLIKSYNNYRNDQESQIIASLDSYLKKFSSFLTDLQNYNQQISLAKKQLEQIKEYYPSLLECCLSEVDMNEFVRQIFDSISSLIKEKMNDLTLCCGEITKSLELLTSFFDTVKCINNDNKSIIEVVNRTKNSIKTERLLL